MNRGFDFLVKETSVFAETGPIFHYFQNFSPDNQHFDGFCHSQLSNTGLISGISDYDLGGEENLFKAPQPIIEQPFVALNHMTSGMSMVLCEEDLIAREFKFTDVESFQSEEFMSNPFYEYNDIFAEESSSPSKILNSNDIIVKENTHPVGKITKRMSSDSLTSVNGGPSRPSSVYFTEMELKKVHGMRRAFSEVYIKPQLMSDDTIETRMQKLSRYRDKKTKRNFGRKIKYACRKALADGQPRIKGRFAKTK